MEQNGFQSWNQRPKVIPKSSSKLKQSKSCPPVLLLSFNLVHITKISGSSSSSYLNTDYLNQAVFILDTVSGIGYRGFLIGGTQTTTHLQGRHQKFSKEEVFYGAKLWKI